MRTTSKPFAAKFEPLTEFAKKITFSCVNSKKFKNKFEWSNVVNAICGCKLVDIKIWMSTMCRDRASSELVQSQFRVFRFKSV